MKILAVDSTASAASTAIVEDGKIIAEFYTNVGLQHSRTLMPMIGNILSCTGLDINDIDCIAVAAGPGSFTGVRIGVAAVKGLAMPRDIPCVAVSTLEELAYNACAVNGVLCPVMDARCSQVYNALFDNSGEKPERLCADRAISIDDLKKELINIKKSVFLVGDGAELCYNNLKGECSNVSIVPQNIRFQHASGVAFATVKAIAEDKTISPAELMPFYLRPPQAVRNLRINSEK